MLELFVGVGVDHINNSVPYIDRCLKKFEPEIATLEVPLWSITSVTLPHRTATAMDKDYEWYWISQLLIQRGIKYFCIEGTTDPDTYPWFTDYKVAASVPFPDTKGINRGTDVITYTDEIVFETRPFFYAIQNLEETNEESIANLTSRNRFAGLAIDQIVQRYKPSRLMHIGGFFHFMHSVQSKGCTCEVTPIQDLISAERLLVYKSRTRRIIYDSAETF
jgi:hypothetical protein